MENNQKPKIIRFNEIKEELMQALNTRSLQLGLKGPVTLVDGFINQPLSMELTSALIIGGPSIPMVMVVENDTGQIHFFALKALKSDV